VSTGDALFSFLAEATAPDDSEKYVAGHRYELIVFIRENSAENAKAVFRTVLSDARWTFPHIKEIAQVDGKMKLAKADKLGLGDAMKAAANHGSSIVVFESKK